MQLEVGLFYAERTCHQKNRRGLGYATSGDSVSGVAKSEKDSERIITKTDVLRPTIGQLLVLTSQSRFFLQLLQEPEPETRYIACRHGQERR